MRASRQRRPIRSPGGAGTLLGALAFGSLALGVLSCSGSTPMDQWITMNPEAGAGFEAPVRETILRTDGGIDAQTDVASGSGDDGGATANDAAAGDDANSAPDGDTGGDASAD